MKSGNERSALAARGDVAGAKVAQNVDPRTLGQARRMIELQGKTLFRAVPHGLTVYGDGRDVPSGESEGSEKFQNRLGVFVGEPDGGFARAFDFVRKTGGGESEERLAKIGREGAVGASETRHASFGRKAHGERIGAVETRSGHESDDEAAHEACSSAVSASSVCAAFCCSSSLALASALRTDGSDSPSSSANLSKALSQTSAWACIWASW